MLKYGVNEESQPKSAAKAEFVVCSYVTEGAFRGNHFDEKVVHQVNDLAKVFQEFEPLQVLFFQPL